MMVDCRYGVIKRTVNTPLFHPYYINYGSNKVDFYRVLNTMGYHYNVLSLDFFSDLPHPPQSYLVMLSVGVNSITCSTKERKATSITTTTCMTHIVRITLVTTTSIQYTSQSIEQEIFSEVFVLKTRGLEKILTNHRENENNKAEDSKEKQ